MAQILKQLGNRERVFTICKDYSLNPSLLTQILPAMARGYNNTTIAQKLGVHRVTVQRYTEALRKMKESEFKFIFAYLAKGVQNAR